MSSVPALVSDIISRQATSDFMDVKACRAALSAMEKAQVKARGILGQGKSSASQESKDQVDTLYRALDRAHDNLQNRWSEFNVAATALAKRNVAHEEAVKKLGHSVMNEDAHKQKVEGVKSWLQGRASTVHRLNQFAAVQHPEEQEKTKEAAAAACGDEDGRAVLEGTTVFSTLKDGIHELVGKGTAQSNEEYLRMGKQLCDLLCENANLHHQANMAILRKQKAERHLEATRKKHTKARVQRQCKMEAIQAYAVTIGDRAITERVREMGNATARLQKAYPHHSKEEINRIVRANMAGVASGGPSAMGEAMMNTVNALDAMAKGTAAEDGWETVKPKGTVEPEGVEKPEDVEKPEGVEGQGDKKEGKKKRRAKGKGEGKGKEKEKEEQSDKGQQEEKFCFRNIIG